AKRGPPHDARSLSTFNQTEIGPSASEGAPVPPVNGAIAERHKFSALLRMLRAAITLEPKSLLHATGNKVLCTDQEPSEGLGCEEKEKYEAWKPKWEAQLSPVERELLKFANERRLDTVKRRGIEAIVEWENIDLYELFKSSPLFKSDIFDVNRQ